MPALNEERNLSSSVTAVKCAMATPCEFEIIILDDGSHDRTGQIGDELAAHDPQIRVVHNLVNRGPGYCYRRGVELARYDYVLMVPGDDETPAATIRTIAEHAGYADIIITYTVNGHIRPVHRRIVSRLFTIIMNALFGLRLRYYNGNLLIRKELLRSIPIDTNFSYLAAVLVRLLKRGCSYIEIGISLQRRQKGQSKALRLGNFASVATSILMLFLETRLLPGVASQGARRTAREKHINVEVDRKDGL